LKLKIKAICQSRKSRFRQLFALAIEVESP
jgi:hypothetical protein